VTKQFGFHQECIWFYTMTNINFVKLILFKVS